jgi:hypothetical protein
MRILGIGLVAMLAVSAPGRALAVEGGSSPYLKGFTGFMSGVEPPPGVYISDIFYYFHGSVGAEVRDGRAEFDIGAHADINLLDGTWVTDATVLGGRYAVSAAMSYLDTGLNATIAGPLGSQNAHLHTGGISDTLLSPVMLGWDAGDWHWNTGLLILVPTGVYHQGALNVGKNVWGFMPQASLTWYSPASGLDVSGTLTYVTTTRNDATDYQSGDILHFDWGIGWHFGQKQEWEIGVNGSVMEQVTGDSGSGAVLGPLEAESFGVGPAVTYRTSLGHTPLSFGAKWVSDFSSHRTIGGDALVMTMTAVF